MRYKFRTVYLLLLLLSSTICNSQSLIRSSINSFGGSTSYNNILLRQSVGQSSNTGNISNSQTLRQGFQQPLYGTTPYAQSNTSSISIKLFPNPASTSTQLIVEGNLKSYDIVITSLIGSQVLKIQSNQLSNIIDCNSLLQGTYIVSIVKNNTVLSSIKLIIQK